MSGGVQYGHNPLQAVKHRQALQTAQPPQAALLVTFSADTSERVREAPMASIIRAGGYFQLLPGSEISALGLEPPMRQVARIVRLAEATICSPSPK